MARLIDPFEQFFDASGDPLVSGKLYFYESGSSSALKDTFADSSETIANSNPVIIGGDGRAPNVFGTGSYRVILTDADSVQILQRDPVGGNTGTTFGADWNSTQIYDQNDIVRDDGSYWYSLVSNNQNNQPSIDGGANWRGWPDGQDLPVGSVAYTKLIGPISQDYADSGIANAYVLTSQGNTPAPTSYAEGMVLTFIPANSNTGASTVNVESLGIINIKNESGTDIAAGEIFAGIKCILRYSVASATFILIPNNSGEKIAWPIVSHNVTDANNDMDFGVGNILNSTGRIELINSAVLVKRLDAAWVSGTNQGGLFSGTKAANTTYHCFLIRKDSDGTIDAGFDTSPIAANIPAGYTAYRRIRSVITNGSSNIIATVQRGDAFYYSTVILEVSTTTPGTAQNTVSITTPSGIRTRAIIDGLLYHSASQASIIFKSTDQTNEAPTYDNSSLSVSPSSTVQTGRFEIRTNTSSQISYRCDVSPLGFNFRIKLIGYIDERI